MKILLPVDGSELSLRAVRYALAMVRQGLDATMLLANVQEGAHLYELLRADASVIERASAAAGAHALEPAQRLLAAAGVAFESEIARGDPAHTIVEIAERFGCDLIVMGAKGHGPLRTAVLGSVSNEVLHAAGVPVLIVKADQALAPDPVAPAARDAAA